MRNWITRFVREEEGASAAEDALIVALVGAALATAAITLGNSIANGLNWAATTISSNTGT